MKKLPTKLRRGSKEYKLVGEATLASTTIPAVQILSERSLQDNNEEEKTIVLTNNDNIGSEITVDSFSPTSDIINGGMDGKSSKASIHKTTASNVEMETFPLKQSSWDDTEPKMLLTASTEKSL